MCWHKWTKWETYIKEGTMQRTPSSKEMLPYSEKRQVRTCVKCGRKQDRKIEK